MHRFVNVLEKCHKKFEERNIIKMKVLEVVKKILTV